MAVASRQVRARKAPASCTRARKRREQNRILLAPGSGDRFRGAYDWFRVSAVYAQCRVYRTQQAVHRGHARRMDIIAEAAQALQGCADRMNVLVPGTFHPAHRLSVHQGRYVRETGLKKLGAAYAWLLLTWRRAERFTDRTGSDARDKAARIKDEAAGRLIKLAEEMDADDFGE